ncbi:MAG: VOC family protein [Actinobacteria bacterium]|nr:VOC family protein [Actinomycetota bacterium]
MPYFGGVDHASLAVTDLDRSHHFYTQVLGLVMLMDLGHARLYLHEKTGFILGLHQHEECASRPFSELNTGLDHISFAVNKEDMAGWEERFDDMGVIYTPLREMEFGAHLNFRDPDNIALEFFAADEAVAGARRALAAGELSTEAFAGLAREQMAGFESDAKGAKG